MRLVRSKYFKRVRSGLPKSLGKPLMYAVDPAVAMGGGLRLKGGKHCAHTHYQSGDGFFDDLVKKVKKGTKKLGQILTSRPVRGGVKATRNFLNPFIKNSLPWLVDQAAQSAPLLNSVAPGLGTAAAVGLTTTKPQLVNAGEKGLDALNKLAEQKGYGSSNSFGHGLKQKGTGLRQKGAVNFGDRAGTPMASKKDIEMTERGFMLSSNHFKKAMPSLGGKAT